MDKFYSFFLKEWPLAIYPALHWLTPFALRRMRKPADDEKGIYAFLYDLADAFGAGNGVRK